MAFLSTRVQYADEDDWKKLGHCLSYLRNTHALPLILSCNLSNIIHWWIDASFGVHLNLRSHTGATVSMGQGSIFSLSTKQKINTRSSTEAELVGVNDFMGLVLWTRLFLEAQGYQIEDNIVYQENESTILLAKNGRSSSMKNTRHIDIRY